jgi:E3 ubiquitin-protein ligase BAH
MKFGHAYKNFLEHGGFPPEWVESAISYQKLKKCIKRVKIELASLGLDSETLQQLLDRAEKINDPDTDGERPLRFAFVNGDGDKQGQILSRRELIRPKLLFLIDEATGEPIDARLSPNTKRYIHELALSRRLTNVQLFDVADDALASIESRKSSTASLSDTDSQRQNSGAGHKLVEVPLTSDHEFFDLLHTELCGLAHLQDQEKHKIGNEITTVGSTLVKAVEPSSKSGRADLDHWRRIFELYMDSRIFFAMGERDHGVQKFSAAQERYNKFLGEAQKTDLLRKFKRKESMIALQNFLRINQELLQNLRFQEINQTAMIKILKSNSRIIILRSENFANEYQNLTNAPRLTRNLYSPAAHLSHRSHSPRPFRNPFHRKSQLASSLSFLVSTIIAALSALN